MIKKLLCFISFLISIQSAWGQTYLIDYTIQNYDFTNSCVGSYCETRSLTGWLSDGSGAILFFSQNEDIGQGTIVTPNKPLKLSITTFSTVEEYGYVTHSCGPLHETYSLPVYGNCLQYSMAISGCVFGSLEFTVRPNLTLAGSATGTYCENQSITLNNTSGFGPVQWQYKVSSGSWTNFNPGSGNSVTFGIQSIFGANYQSSLRQPIYFRYNYGSGGCDPTTNFSNALGPYTFNPLRPLITQYSAIPPTCKDYTDAVILIESVNRALLNGEILTYTVYTTGNVFVTQTSSTKQPSPSDPVEIYGDVALGGIPSGTYKILVETNYSLCGAVQYYNLSISNPTAVTFTHDPPIPPSCNVLATGVKNNGSITVNASGGTGNNYQFSKDNGTSYQLSSTLSNLTVGDYTVRVKDGNGCLSPATVVSVSEPPDITINSVAVASSYNGSDISCYGSSDGEITVLASGGTGVLDYAYDGLNFQSSNLLGALPADDYTITVRDANNCTKQSSVVPVVSPPAITATLAFSEPTCFGYNDASVIVNNSAGGTGALSYALDALNFQSTPNFTNLSAGDYTITIHDANNCAATLNTTVTQPPAVIVSATPTIVTCAGGNDGAIQVNTTNVVGSPTFSLNGGTFQSSSNFAGLTASNYSITVKDQHGCLASTGVVVGSNPPITGSISVGQVVSCFGGTDGALNLTSGGGVGPYTYSWSNGSTAKNISGLSANSYTVTIRDSKNCEKIFSKILTQPQPISISGFVSDFNGFGVSCFGSADGWIDISTSGGNGGYTYQWSNGSSTEDLSAISPGHYDLQVKDVKNCLASKSFDITQPPAVKLQIDAKEDILCYGGSNGSIVLSATGGVAGYEFSKDNGTSWQSTALFQNLLANNYAVLVKDANDCRDNVQVLLTSPTELILSINEINNTTCSLDNGSADVSATGGFGNYDYVWFDQANNQLATGSSITELGAGIYSVNVKDENSCEKTRQVLISSSEGPVIEVLEIVPTRCFGTEDGEATIAIDKGKSPYIITWSDNQSEATARGLQSGDYIVTVKDADDCLVLQNITVPSPPPLLINVVSKQDPNCNGNANGMIKVEAAGGNGNYEFEWNNGSTDPELTNRVAGTYTITVTDENECQTSTQVILTDPPVFEVDAGKDQTICEGQKIIREVDAPDAAYLWTGPNDFSSGDRQVTVSDPGVYHVKVISKDGCEANAEFEIIVDPDLLHADFLMVSQAFAGDTIVVIDISWPLPENVEWKFDPNAVVVDADQDYALIRFDTPGTYVTKLNAQLAQCNTTYSQSIVILDNPHGNPGGRVGDHQLIDRIDVYPNPVTELLNVEIDLAETHETTLQLYQLQSNQKAYETHLTGESSYHQTLNLAELPSGMYVVIIKAGDEIRSIKLVKL